MKIMAFLVIMMIIFVSISTASAATKILNIAVIETVEQDSAQNNIFRQEILNLLGDQRKVYFTSYAIPADGDPAKSITALNAASNAPEIDMILVLDIAANQNLGHVPTFKKPTFLPYVFNAQLSHYPLSGKSSGKKNLNYQTLGFDIQEELEILQTITPFKKAVLISNPRTKSSLRQDMLQATLTQAKKAGVDLTIQVFNGTESNISLPPQTDAVLYGFLTTATLQQKQGLIDGINQLGIPSFSLTGEKYVRMGSLATNVPTTDWERLARRTALNMEEVLMGTDPGTQPVFFETSNRLMINMATSRQIRVAPSFDVLSDSILINETPQNTAHHYSLTDVARLAVQENLSLAAQRLQASRANKAVDQVRGALLPQIQSSIDYSTRKDSTNAVQAGTVAENSTDGSISLVQSIFSEELWAAYAIEKYAALSEKERLREIELDITQAAVNAYLNVLLSQTALNQDRYNLDITRENYRLAENRVKVGTQTAADLFRWESELANAKQAVLVEKSNFERQKQQLNQILNRPINEDFTTTVETLNNPNLLISDPRIITLIKNTYDLEALTDFFVEIGLDRAPEVKQTQANMDASRRQLQSDQRAYWLPDFNLTSEYTSNFDEERAAGSMSADDSDWRVGLQLSLPLYEGGARYAKTAQSRLNVQQLETNLKDTKNQIEQDIRNNLESAHASFESIPLTKQAEEAAQRNYDLINDSYLQGARSITDVLDAQETLIAAREAAMNAVYALLIDLMNVQRAIGAYDFFLTDTQRMEFSDELIERVMATR